MSGLLPVGWSDLATHDDLAVQGAALRTEMIQLPSHVDQQGAALRAEMAQLRSHVDQQGAGLRADMAELRGELSTAMIELRGELSTAIGVGFADVRTEMHKSYMSALRWCMGIMVSLGAIFATLVVVL
jgi:hypothetical protein